MDQASTLRTLVDSHDKQFNQKNMTNAKVITVSSGKGGVGKSNFVANLAISLSRLGKEVVIVDADLGLANIEVLFDIIPRKTLKNVVFDNENIKDVMTKGPLGIQFLSGGSGIREIAKIGEIQQKRLINSFAYLDDRFDYILIDTGAGISDLVLNFIKSSHETYIVCTPEPTSITDAYALLKVASEYTKDTCVMYKLIVNKVENKNEALNIYNKLSYAIEKFLNMEIELLGYLSEDVNLVKSVKKQVPIAMGYQNSKYTKEIKDISISVTDNSNVNVDEKSTFLERLVNVFNK
ncbi:MAG: MinD/ParA family protein [Lachnospirales bacterium]